MADLEGGTALSLDRHLGASDTAEAIESYTEIEIPESLRDNLVLFLRMERRCSRSTIRPSALSSTVCSTA